MGTTTGDRLTVQRDGAVLTLTLNRPDRLNAVTTALLDDLADQLEHAALDADLRVVVLTGAGRAFCAGADLTMAPASQVTAVPGPQTLHAANRVVRALRAAPQPVVAAVNGPAVGVGFSIALACDLVVAAREAYFLLAFTDIGLMPDGGASALVAAAVGRARALSMALVPTRIPAPQALDWGLIHKVVPAGDLTVGVQDLVSRLAVGAPLAYAATKRAINDATLGQLEPALERELAGQSELMTTADFGEAVAAFGEKRRPRFSGS
jgi:enoyl-CoA hydratase